MSSSLSALNQIAEFADRFDGAWRRGERPRIEDFLAELPESRRLDVLTVLLEIELEIRRVGGAAPNREEYLSRFPADAAVIANVFAAPRPAPHGKDFDSSRALPETMPILKGYEVVRFLGSGGFSEVWLAEDSNLFGREVALKVLKPRSSPEQRDSALTALRNEAELLVKLRHPNVVQVFAWVKADEDAVLVLQYVSGGSLADRLLRDGPLDWQTAARYVADVGEGLQSIHARGLIHRDVKPANILWDPEIDEALLTDLGVGARLASAARPAGTIPYMAPEAFDGTISEKLDVYGLAATLYTLVTGSRPYPGPTISDLRLQAQNGLPQPDPRCAGLPEPLEQIVRAGLAAEPEQRPSLHHFVAALRVALNQLLVDALTMRTPPQAREPATEPATGAGPLHGPEPTTEPEPWPDAPVHVHLIVKSQVGAGPFVPVAGARTPHKAVNTRDMKKVPASPEKIRVTVQSSFWHQLC